MDVDRARLDTPLGEAMFTQRSIRRLRPDPIPLEDIHLILEAAVKAPSGGNSQPARFLVAVGAPRWGSNANETLEPAHGPRHP